MRSKSKPRLQTLKPRIQFAKSTVRSVSNEDQRITGSRWIKIKKIYERHHPRLCVECDRQGKVGNGDELDHIIPLWAGGTNDEHNLQWLCVTHHKEKTAKEASIRSGALHIS